ncbi:MAG: penicillin-binding protein [Yaniella sp.]|uniref:transglycosylase domain-containing protein n=2 Tax=Yaniella sp. TaxID=2773929 RepID=UPI0026498989|nr:transglycosylase domain-containing protein [Yaniella sp.]MDN5818508.1 penicillin-binding protein [Yaniella sp.]MDN5889973.1 penicillin-binding protein [Yaniella sp.]MDN6149530.1 penicillin-binding protein [Yaniella sp.]MDN6457456.1 penicillin-binding protein [Yaniella sp.]MDN6521523.1 penicillin-binding protein [Yaniella sp.]
MGQIVLFVGLSVLVGIVAAVTVLPALTAVGDASSAGVELLEENPAEFRQEALSEPSTFYASDGETELAQFYAENREPVGVDDISQSMQDAIVSIEDERFYEHDGTDPQALGRAVVNNLTGSSTQGASTLTHQYVSLELLNADYLRDEDELVAGGTTTIADRFNEARLAVDVEEEMSKEEILEGFLNLAFFGDRNYGVEAAAQYYWGVPASELDVQQSATLAGLVQNPNGFNPETNPEAAEDRRNTVVGTMLRNEYITQEEHDAAVESDLELDITPEATGCVAASTAPYFCDYVQRVIMSDDTFGPDREARERLLNRGGLEVTTTLDKDAQEAAENEVLDAVPNADPSGAGSALVSVEPDGGQIRAMAQNTNYTPEEGDGNTELNFSVDAAYGGGNGFQGGSTLKPFVFAAWLEGDNSMTDTIDASKNEWDQGDEWTASCQDGGSVDISDEEGWSVNNAIDDMNREMTADFGLYWSINTATTAVAEETDLCDITDLLSRVGYQRADDGAELSPADPSFVLGSQEVSPLIQASAFATLANDGEYCAPRALEEVTDAQGNEYDIPEANCEQAIDSEVVAELNETLIPIAEERTAEGDPEFPMAGKTGTDNFESSTWFNGYTTGLSTSAWAGRYTDLESLRGSTIGGEYYENLWGSELAGPMWLNYMNEVAPDYSTDEFTTPDDSPHDDPDDMSRYDIPGGSPDEE